MPVAAVVATLGLTTTYATAAGTTVTTDVPATVPEVALIVAVPGATALTLPLPFTVATDGALVPQVTLRPFSGLPTLSRGVAVSWSVPPSDSVGAEGLTLTLATGTLETFTCAEP